MEGNKEKNEEKKGLTVGKTEACPCHTRPKEAEWDEEQWKTHWASLRAGHLKRIEQLHKGTRDHG